MSFINALSLIDLLGYFSGSQFQSSLVVGARRAGLSISKTADLLGISRTTISRFTENGSKKRKYPVSSSCVDENALLMSEENGQTG